jgi:hypothetical protein
LVDGAYSQRRDPAQADNPFCSSSALTFQTIPIGQDQEKLRRRRIVSQQSRKNRSTITGGHIFCTNVKQQQFTSGTHFVSLRHVNHIP